MLLVFLGTLSFLTFLVFVKERNEKFLLFASVFAGLAFLTNRVALSLYALYGLYFLLDIYKHRKIKIWILLIILALIIPSGFFVRNLILYKTITCESIPYLPLSKGMCNINRFHALTHYKGQAIPIGTEQTTFSMGLTNYVDFAYGNYWFMLFGLFSGIILLYKRRDKLFLPIILYILFLALIFPKVSHRAEDTARYTLTWVADIAIVVAVFYESLYEFLNKYKKHLGLIVILLVIGISYVNAKSKANVMVRVKSWPSSFFQACSWVRQNTPANATIYTIWSHNAVYCSQRNIAQASDLPDVALSYNVTRIVNVLKSNGVDYLWIQKGSIDPYNREYVDNYPSKFVQLLLNNPKVFIKVYDNGEDISRCLNGGCVGSTIFKLNQTV